MTLQANLAMAREAVGYVNSLRLLSSSSSSDRIARVGGMEAAIASGSRISNRRGRGGPLEGAVDAMRLTTSFSDHPTLQEAIWEAQQAKAAGVGNCEEMSLLVIEYLHSRGLGPADVMALRGFRYDHMFVVIGLAPEAGISRTDPNSRLGIMRQNLRDWGPDAVWCDPFQNGGTVFAVSDLIAGNVRNLDFRLKCHTAESVVDGVPRSILRIEPGASF